MLERFFKTKTIRSPRFGLSMQTKLIIIFLLAKVIPLILLTVIAWRQFLILGNTLQSIAFDDSTAALDESAVRNIERMTTDAARLTAEFLYGRDADILYVSRLEPTEENYRAFLDSARRRVIKQRRWELSPDGSSWTEQDVPPAGPAGTSSNSENDLKNAFHAIPAETFEYTEIPLYDEITFISTEGMETVKYTAPDSPKRRYPPDSAKKDISRRENTYVGAETYFAALQKMRPGEIYVSDVIGAYTGTNYIGTYTPENLRKARDQGSSAEYAPTEQAFAGMENPNGRRFEGIIRWAMPVAGEDGTVAGYVTLALNHDHIMEFVDHLTPMDERYTSMTLAGDGNYAFIWDYKCRSIAHPRHHSIVGCDPETGEPQVPWLEESIYDGWKKSGLTKWTDYVKDIPEFHEQSRNKKFSAELARQGLVGLDGRYLNFAPQCVGWMDLTQNGGSGSFYIFWSGVEKLNTAAAIPYYTGQYAPSPENGFSRRGFGFVAVGSGLEHFNMPAAAIREKLGRSISENMAGTALRLVIWTAVLTGAVILIALWMARGISRPVRSMADHMSRLAIGDFSSTDVPESSRLRGDEIGLLARSLQSLTIARRDELDMANALAQGDYTRTIPLRSDMDQLGKALNAMIRVNKHALCQVSQAVEEVSYGADAVSSVSVSLSQGVQTSQEVLKSVTATVDTVDQQAQENAGHARGANQLAAESCSAARRGYEAVTELTQAMTEIQQAGQKIASVVKLIDDIAFQTNLLALNAAVEAARAGRHGRGFSVVAEEVRNLSARSAKAAHETGQMVTSMLALMETGALQAQHSDREFKDIVETTTGVARIFESIVDASNAQSSAMSQIVDSLDRIDGVTLENSHNAQQMSSSAATLSRQAEELRQLVSHFRLGAQPARRALNQPHE